MFGFSPLPKRNIYSILWIILWLIFQGNVSLFSVTMSGRAWILDVVLSKFVLYKLSRFSKTLVTSSYVWRFECKWRGKYQVSKFYVAILIRPSACHWSHIKHKTNRLDESHCTSARPAGIALQWIDGLSYSYELDTANMKGLFFFCIGFFKFIHRELQLCKSNTYSNQFNTRNQSTPSKQQGSTYNN